MSLRDCLKGIDKLCVAKGIFGNACQVSQLIAVADVLYPCHLPIEVEVGVKDSKFR